MKPIHFLVAIGLLVIAGPADAQPTFALEHFRCYPVRKIDPDVTATVDLLDQFNTPEVGIDVRRAVRFCNPTRKFHQGQLFNIEDPRQHLTFYATFPQEGPLRVAVVDNQFGQQVLLLREPVALAVPTLKLDPPHRPPVGLDHFRCYAAHGTAAIQPVVVALSDQFITPFTGHFVLNPVSFCNPVRKRHGDQITEIQHPDAHLTCYSTTRVRFTRETAIENQFGANRLVVGPPDRLCVPTRKLAWREIPDLPLGTSAEALSSLLGRR